MHCSLQYVSGIVGRYEVNWEKEKIDLIKGLATFDDAQTVRVKLNAGGERLIKAAKVLVAVGGRPAMPEDVPGIELAISSDGFFDLEQQPKKVAVLGAGYIAVEMAGIFHGLGSETHLFFRGQTVRPHGQSALGPSPQQPTCPPTPPQLTLGLWKGELFPPARSHWAEGESLAAKASRFPQRCSTAFYFYTALEPCV